MQILSVMPSRLLLVLATLAGAANLAAAQIHLRGVSTAVVRGPGVTPGHARAVAPPAVDSSRLQPMIMVELLPGKETLPALLKRAAAKAIASGRRPFVELGSPGCGNCVTLKRRLADPRMVDAFRGTYIIDLSGSQLSDDRWNAWWQQQLKVLDRIGIDYEFHLPAFFELDSTGTVTGQRIDAMAFDNFNDDTTLGGMPGPLKLFFRRTIAAATWAIPHSTKPAKPGTTVELLPERGTLSTLLKQAAAQAIASGRTPFLMLDGRGSSTPWCYTTCEKFHAVFHDTQVLDAFQGTYVVHIDVDRWKDHANLSALLRNPFTLPAFPVLFALDSAGTVTGQRIDALAFESMTPEGMAKPLQRFFEKNLWNF